MKNNASLKLEKTENEDVDVKQVLYNLLPSIVINAILPILIFLVMEKVLHQSDFLSIIATAVPSILFSLIGIIRSRRIDFLAGLTLLGIVVSLLFIAVSSDPKLLLIRDSFFTAALGLAFLVSLLFPRPLTYYGWRTMKVGNSSEHIQRLDSKWQDPSFRSRMYAQTVIWGVGLFLEAIVRISLVFIVPVTLFVVISPLVQWGTIGATFAVSKFYTYLIRK